MCWPPKTPFSPPSPPIRCLTRASFAPTQPVSSPGHPSANVVVEVQRRQAALATAAGVLVFAWVRPHAYGWPYLNASGVHACIPDPAFLAGLQHSRPQVALPPQKFNMFRDPGRPVGWDPFNTILGVRTQLGTGRCWQSTGCCSLGCWLDSGSFHECFKIWNNLTWSNVQFCCFLGDLMNHMFRKPE